MMKTRDFIFLLISLLSSFSHLCLQHNILHSFYLPSGSLLKNDMEMFTSPSPGFCGIFGFLILYSLCQYVENLRRKTFHFLQLKSLQSFRDRKVCGWDGCSPEACTSCILRCFLRRRSRSGALIPSCMVPPVQNSSAVCGPGCQHPASAAAWCFSAVFPLSKGSLSEEEDSCGFIQV